MASDARELRGTLEKYYLGRSRNARRFRFLLLAFDSASIIFFIGSSLIPPTLWIYVVDAFIALIILADFLARFWITDDKKVTLRGSAHGPISSSS